MRHLFVWVFATVLAGGCATPTASSTTPSTPPPGARSRSMLHLDDEPLGEPWKQWTPAQAPRVPDELGRRAEAFDVRRVADADAVEACWSAVFSLLDRVRDVADTDTHETIRMLMTVLEPGEDADSRFDLTFVTSPRAARTPWEGVLLRVTRPLKSGGEPAVVVLLRRPVGGGARPDTIRVWLSSGFREAPSLSGVFRRGVDGWTSVVAHGISWKLDSGQADRAAAYVMNALVAGVWERFTGARYVESADETAPGEPVAGLRVHDRDVDQVYSDTVFPPRMNFDLGRP